MPPVSQRFFDLTRNEHTRLKKEFHVKRIGIFGSCVRGEDTENSDIDVLVEFNKKTFDIYMDLKFFLEDKLGRKVDLVIIDSLKPGIKDKILEEVKYAA